MSFIPMQLLAKNGGQKNGVIEGIARRGKALMNDRSHRASIICTPFFALDVFAMNTSLTQNRNCQHQGDSHDRPF
jgi:hypothetical protein